MSSETFMSWWPDVLTSLWMLFVAVLYFGGFFLPTVGALTAPASAGYAAMLLISVATALARRLGRAGTQGRQQSSDTEHAHGRHS